MELQEAISCLKADKEYLVDYEVCDGEEIDIAIELMEKQLNNCNNCRFSESTRGLNLYCFFHCCYIKQDNLCRDWEAERA
ncbi:MAG: hypothetical protein ACI4E1_07720 [Lachnospira sp.]